VSLKAIIFDLDDTLYCDEDTRDRTLLTLADSLPDDLNIDREEFRHTVRWTVREVFYSMPPLKELALTTGISSWESLWMQVHGDDEKSRRLQGWLEEYRRDGWQASLDKLGLAERLDAQEMADQFMKLRRQNHTIYADVIECLERLRNQFRLALLTNGVVDLQREKIEGAGLESHFDVITISGEVGLGKPDRQVFDLTLKRLDLSADEVVMVGNSLESDIAGANGVGMKSVWLNRINAKNDTQTKPDAEITNLDMLETVL
jgi:putative hydrolase of the HAD superfamily